MNSKKITMAISLLLSLLLLYSCVENNSNSNTSNENSVNGSDIVSTPAESKPSYNYSTTFENFPKTTYESATINITGDTLIIECINPGLNSFECEIISYSLSEDKLLGQLKLGNGRFKTSPIDGGFAVTDMDKRTTDYYGINCVKSASVKIAEDCFIDFAAVSFDGRYILTQNCANNDLILYDRTVDKSHTISSGKIYTKVEYSDGRFYLLGGGAYILEPDNNHYYSISETVYTYGVSKNNIVGINGSYIVSLSASKGESKMASLGNISGNIIDTNEYGCVTVEYNGNGTTVYFLGTDNYEVSIYTDHGMTVSAKQISDSTAVVISKNAENLLSCRLIDISGLKTESLTVEKLNGDKISGVAELPDYYGNQETVALVKKLEADFGVRVLFSNDLFSMSDFGYEIRSTDEATAYRYMQKLGDYFKYYPEGLLKEAGLGRPIVLYLCDTIQKNIEGLSIYRMGHNVIYINVGGSDTYFLSNLTHEFGHAFENGMNPTVINGWVKLMPEEVVKAYGDGIGGISVEYTADDMGKTPVWFANIYGRRNEQEDRATIFQKMYEAYISGDMSMYKYDGLKKKADYWSYMLRETYESCKNAKKLNWEPEN